MTKAEEAVHLWKTKTKTLSIRKLLLSMHEPYNPDRMYEDGINVYYLSDGSKLLTTRSTKNFQIWSST